MISAPDPLVEELFPDFSQIAVEEVPSPPLII